MTYAKCSKVLQTTYPKTNHVNVECRLLIAKNLVFHNQSVPYFRVNFYKSCKAHPANAHTNFKQKLMCVQDLSSAPKLVADGGTKDNLTEGENGNAWFLSACAALAKEKKLLHKVQS